MLFILSVSPLTVQLHEFCNASIEAYAAVVYLRITYSDNTTTSMTFALKTRVPPQIEMHNVNPSTVNQQTVTASTTEAPNRSKDKDCKFNVALYGIDECSKGTASKP